MAIVLVDCDNFFASCERVMQPYLKSKPLAVLSNNDGCIIARTQEVKAAGIPMGAPVHLYKNQLDRIGAVCVSANFLLYRHFAKRLQGILSAIPASSIEVYSIDESFLEIPDSILGQHSEEWALQLRKCILTWTDIPVSIGIAPSRALAKLAVHFAKQTVSHVRELNPEINQTDLELLKEVEIGEVWGIGRKLAPKFAIAGIRTAYDLYRLDMSSPTIGVLDKPTRTLVYELRGWNSVDINHNSARHSITYSRSFGAPVSDFIELRASIVTYVTKAAQKLRRMGLSTNCIVVYVAVIDSSSKSVRGRHKSSKITMPWTSDSGVIIEHAVRLAEELFVKGDKYRKAGVIFPETLQKQQLNITDTETSIEQSVNLMTVLDELAERHGTASPQFGSSLIKGSWQARQNNISPFDHTTWATIPEVKTT